MFLQTKRPLARPASAVFALAAIALPVTVFAQPAPSYAVHQDSLQGTISHFDGQYTMYVNDDRGFMDRVELHQGTVINPTGIRLDSGFRVTIYGYPSGGVFVANEIDTPYHRYGYYRAPAYYPAFAVGVGYGWGWGYPHRYWR